MEEKVAYPRGTDSTTTEQIKELQEAILWILKVIHNEKAGSAPEIVVKLLEN